jgi:membrane protein YqaA with SNARE-associated domain
VLAASPMFTALKDRTIALAKSKHAERGLFILAFAESSFFPIPPDVALGPMAGAHPEKWARFAFITALASVLGSLLGYAIGYFFAETLGKAILNLFGLWGAFERFRANSTSVMPYIILLQGLIPVPYKLVTIACGMLRIPIWILVVCSILTRSVRFFAVAFLFKQYGPAMWPVMQRRVGLFAALGLGLVVVALVALHYLRT